MNQEQKQGVDGADCSAWFILYDGSSPDGRGYPQFCGRTTDAKKALKHFKTCKKNLYSTGQVRIVTDTEEGLAHNEQSFDAFILPNADVLAPAGDKTPTKPENE